MSKKIEIGSMVTKILLNKRYWHGAAYELKGLEYLHDPSYDDDAPERKRGEVKRYKVLKALPDRDTLQAEARAKFFTMPLYEALDQAKSEVEEIKDEMTSWRDNLEASEGLSQTSKADEVREAADALEYIDIPSEVEDVPEFLQEQEDDDGKETRPAFSVTLSTYLVTWFPWRAKRKRTGRTARLNDAASVFQQCSEALQEHLDDEKCKWTEDEKSEAKDLIDALQNLASELESIECPGMY